jgi:Excalibur calcium-binding domain
MTRLSFLKVAVPLVVATFSGVYYIPLPDAAEPPISAGMKNTEQQRNVQWVYYAGCDEVRRLSKAPLYRDDPGYREGMDGDGDGIACEPHP